MVAPGRRTGVYSSSQQHLTGLQAPRSRDVDSRFSDFPVTNSGPELFQRSRYIGTLDTLVFIKSPQSQQTERLRGVTNTAGHRMDTPPFSEGPG